MLNNTIKVLLVFIGLTFLAACNNEANESENSNTEVEVKVEPTLTIEEVNAAQQAWCDALVKIGEIYTEGGDYKGYANQVLTDAYDYDNGTVFFKPTLAYGERTFRTTKEGALSYFVGGDPNYPEDKGFAIKPWIKARYDNIGDGQQGVQIYGNVGITMGHVYCTDKDGNETMVEKVWVFKKGDDGKVRIILHKSALPFDPNKK